MTENGHPQSIRTIPREFQGTAVMHVPLPMSCSGDITSCTKRLFACSLLVLRMVLLVPSGRTSREPSTAGFILIMVIVVMITTLWPDQWRAIHCWIHSYHCGCCDDYDPLAGPVASHPSAASSKGVPGYGPHQYITLLYCITSRGVASIPRYVPGYAPN